MLTSGEFIIEIKENNKESIGQGGNGFIYPVLNIIYRGKKLELQQDYVVKKLKKTYRKALERLKEEKCILKQLKTIEGAPQIFEYDNDYAEGEDFYVMPLYYKSDDFFNGRCNLEQKLKFLISLGKILKAVHEKKIVHRDLKPGNILLDSKNKPIICDFGLAFRVERDLSITASEERLGSRCFMAPELYEPLRIKNYDDDLKIQMFQKVDAYAYTKIIICSLLNVKYFEYSSIYSYFQKNFEKIYFSPNRKTENACRALICDLFSQGTEGNSTKRATVEKIISLLTEIQGKMNNEEFIENYSKKYNIFLIEEDYIPNEQIYSDIEKIYLMMESSDININSFIYHSQKYNIEKTIMNKEFDRTLFSFETKSKKYIFAPIKLVLEKMANKIKIYVDDNLPAYIKEKYSQKNIVDIFNPSIIDNEILIDDVEYIELS